MLTDLDFLGTHRQYDKLFGLETDEIDGQIESLETEDRNQSTARTELRLKEIQQQKEMKLMCNFLSS